LHPYEDFYRTVHHHPEISGMETQTAALVAEHLSRLGFRVHEGIGGHGVAGVFENGDGNVILMRAELDALPILEETTLTYKSAKRMTDRYGNERPVMHACGHDMNMATLLGSAALLKSSAEKWSGTLVVIFQPDEEEAGGARAMVNDGLYSLVPKPDIMLAQHVVPSAAGTVAIRSGPVLVAADSANVRITGGPCQSINPQQCIDPIPLAMKIILRLQDAVRDEVGPDEDATVACWGFHAGIPGNDYVAFVDFLLDIKTIKPDIREKVLAVIDRQIRDGCKTAGTPEDPIIHFNVRAPLTQNDPSHTETISQAFSAYFADQLIEMQFTRSTEDFSTLGASHDVPYIYWNYGGSECIEEPVAINHSPFFAPSIYPTLLTGTDAMALAALTYLLGGREGSGGNAQV
jgi:amidohydrolase